MPRTALPSRTSVAVTALCRGLLVMVASMALWAVLPAALGWHVTVVMSGSMEPALRPGDVVASRTVDAASVHPGQVLLVDDPDHEGRLRLHRLSKVADNGQLVLRGDANRTDDSTPVSRNAVHGVGSLRVPFIGAPAYWLCTHQFVPLVPTVLTLVLLMLGATRRHDWPDDDGDPSDDGARSDTDGESSDEADSRTAQPVLVESRAQLRAMRGRDTLRDQAGHPRRKTLVILTTAVLAIATVATNAPAQAATAFKATTINSGSSWSAAASFSSSCRAGVLSDKPYLYYPFGEKSGTTASDASGNGRNGTYNTLLGAGVSYGATGPCASDGTTGVTLDGALGWVSTPGSITAPKVFTTEIWFRTTTTRGGALIAFRSPVVLGLFSSYDRQLYLDNSGRLLFGLSGDTVSTVASTSSYNDGSWHLADVTTSSTGTDLYVDGARVAGNSAMTSPVDATGAWRIGDGGFTGWPSAPASDRPAVTVQGAAIYPAALSSAQISAHYAAR